MHSVWKRWACNVPAEVEEKERGEEEEVREISGRSAITSVTQRDREGEEEEEECWYQEKKMDNRITE